MKDYQTIETDGVMAHFPGVAPPSPVCPREECTQLTDVAGGWEIEVDCPGGSEIVTGPEW